MVLDPTVFLVDDDPGVIDALSFRFSVEGLKYKTYASAQSFLDEYDPEKPGCLVVDNCMPGMTGIELLENLNSRGFHLPVIVLTGHPEVPGAVRALKDGAVDYIEKEGGEQALLGGVRDALCRDAEIREQALERAAIQARIRTLTKRQLVIMQHVATGKSSKEIARILGRHKKTVESHRTIIMNKLQAGSIAELVHMVLIAPQPGN